MPLLFDCMPHNRRNARISTGNTHTVINYSISVNTYIFRQGFVSTGTPTVVAVCFKKEKKSKWVRFFKEEQINVIGVS